VSVARLAAALESRLQGRVETDWPLARFTTYRLGGPARLYVELASADDLLKVGNALLELDDPLPVLVLGRGSNLVVSDKGWPGVVIRPGAEFAWLQALDDEPTGTRAPRLRAGAATSMPLLANWSARRGLSGLEFAIAIPGSVGGAVRMNAGAHGTETSDSLHSARIFDLGTAQLEERSADNFGFSYRHSNLGEHHVVVDATWSLETSEVETVRSEMEGYRRHRAATQPGAVQNAGSVFKNPEGDSAGRLVEAAGLKGCRIGGASVSTLHANFFIAAEGATAQDVFELVHAVREKVKAVFGIELEAEIRFAGPYEEPSHQMVSAGSP
jgi:UDP-N-acetylmuramate dehydrogenase